MLEKGQGIAILRITVGLLFLVAGISKIMNPAGVAGMLGNIGFPIASIFAWILIIIEIVGGLALITGKEIRKAVWPLFIVLLVALLLVYLPGFNFSDQQNMMMILWHLVGLGALLSLHTTGPGKLF